MKKLILFSFLYLLNLGSSFSQCTNSSVYGSVTAPTSGTATISTCSYLSEYSTLNSVAASTIYQCAIGTGGYITIHEGTPSGPVVGYGASPLTWTSTVAGTYYAHWNVNAACATSTGCVTTTITYVSPGSACVDPATAGTTVSSPTAACPGQNINLTLSGASTGSGLTYQWQSSTDGISYSNIAAATNSSYSGTQSVSTYYQCIVTCGAGTPSTSTPVQVNMNSYLNCYCTSSATNAFDEEILNVSISTLNNSSTCSTTGGPGSTLSLYSDYTTNVAAPVLAASAAYPFSVQVGTCGGNFNSMFKIYIDYNQNGSFTDVGEQVFVSASAINGPYTTTGTITIPATATVGLTRMRIVNVETSSAASINSCGTYGYGETEDYFVNIAPIPSCPQPTALSLISADLNSAQIQWTAGGSETEWQIEYGIQGFSQGTGTLVTTSSNPYTIPGLTPNSFYQAYVRGICAPGDTSYWAGTVSWNTYNQDQYMEYDNSCPISDFIDITATGTALNTTDDSEAGVTLPFPLLYQGSLYTQITIGNNGGVVLGTLTGTVGYTMTAGNGLYPYVQDMNTPYDNVYYTTIGTAPNRQFVVMWSDLAHYYSTAQTDGTTFELILDEATNEIYFVYDDVIHDNPSYNYGADAEIGVRGTNQNINVSMNSPTYLQNNTCAHFYYTDCPKPTNFILSYVLQEEAAFSWTAGLSAETNWTVIYGPDGFDPTSSGTTITTTTNSATLPGLSQLTTYDVYIYADCDVTSQSFALTGTFMTLPFCSNPSGLGGADAVDSLFASWAWVESSPVYPATSFNIQYGVFGFDIYTGTEVVADGLNLADTIVDASFMGSGVYQYYVQAVCGADTSSFIGPFTFTMPLSNDTVCGAEMLTVDGTVYVFNNVGATVSAGETIITPLNTGYNTSDLPQMGWGQSTLERTTWYTFEAPASGNLRMDGLDLNTTFSQVAVYEVTNCGDFNTFTLVAASDQAIGVSTKVATNFTICGLTPGNTYYLMHDSWTSGGVPVTGNFSLKLTPINITAGTDGSVVDVCSGNDVVLFNGISAYDAGGTWSSTVPVVQISLMDSLFMTNGLAYQTYSLDYVVVDGCANDSSIAQIKVWAPSSAGEDGSVNVCRNEPVDLLSGLNGNVDFNGTWYNPGWQAIPNSEIVSSNIQGSYNYRYIVGNGVCPEDTSIVLVVVSSSCNYLSVSEMALNEMEIHPNPSTGIFYIDNSFSQAFNYEVKDVNGKAIVENETLNQSGSTKVDLSSVEPGIYLIHVYNNENKRIFRIVKQ